MFKATPKFILGWLCFFYSFSTAPQTHAFEIPTSLNSKIDSLATEQYWLRLLHYKKRWFGGYKSEADGKEFFLNPEGKTNPKAELRSTLESFDRAELRIGNLKQHPQCAFPERYRYLRTQIKELETQIKPVRCPEFEEWQARFRPRSATIVFASAYLNNPASLFGHTFLRIDSEPRPGHTEKNDLLDYGINFAANAGDDGGITFAFLGLMGGYPGYFSLLPYFKKVNEYTNGESRDLWEYKLKLNPEQIHRMINHVWELGTTYFNYYFFDENCSYHLLALLEVANPEWHLTDQFIYDVIPSNTIRLLNQTDGALVEAKFRPSLHRVLNARVSALSSQEQENYRNAVKNNFTLTGKESARVIDALLENRKYTMFTSQITPTAEWEQIQHLLRIARAQAPDASTNTDPEIKPNESRPDIGNNSSKIGLWAGSFDHAPYIAAEFRIAYHGLLELDDGYLNYSELNLLRTRLRYYPGEKRLRLHEFKFVEVASFAPIDSISTPISWAFALGAGSPGDFKCANCTAAQFNGGAGLSSNVLGIEQFLVLGMLRGNLELSGFFDSNIRFGPSLQIGAIGTIASRAKMGIFSEAFFYPTQEKIRRQFLKTWVELNIRPFPQFELKFQTQYFKNVDKDRLDWGGAISWYF